MSDTTVYANALLYHALPRPGKIEVVPTKPLMTQEDLSLGYTPGVAEVCREIQANPEQANFLTSKANLVGVITNGTAVLGLGNIGPLAAKPVMEGKSVLFKKFANIDVFDLEISETDPDAFIATVARLAPTFGGINLEDIKAPECFYIEEKLRELLDIPVLHDDQHGTAIIVCAAFQNAIHITKKKAKDVRIVCVGAGAAGLACMNLLVEFGVSVANITLVDIDGVIHAERPDLNQYTQKFAHATHLRTLGEALVGADVFFGLSAGGVLKPEMLAGMNDNPLIFAMANPDPEIMPDVARQVRPDAIIGTGRSDFPNQINNVLGFPYLFRGALDVGAKVFNTEMKLAAAKALANLARKEADAALSKAYKGAKLKFGPEYLIPKPFDPRLLGTIAPAVAQAAQDSGVATRPLGDDLSQYANALHATLDQSFAIMRQIYAQARKEPKRIVFPEGEEARILQAAQSIVNEQIAHPILLGREDIVRPLLQDLGLPMQEGQDFTLIDPQTDARLPAFEQAYYNLRKRDGVTPGEAAVHLRSRWMTFGCMLVKQGEAHGLVAGTTGRFGRYVQVANQIINESNSMAGLYALQVVMSKERVLFLADTHLTPDPTAEQLLEMAHGSIAHMRNFGVEPKVALVSHANFGSTGQPSAQKMAHAREKIAQAYPELPVEGELQADAALDYDVLQRIFPTSALQDTANLLLFPNVDAANIAFNILRTVQPGAEYIGPIILGMQRPVHILSVEAPVRRIVNLTALCVVEAQQLQGRVRT